VIDGFVSCSFVDRALLDPGTLEQMFSTKSRFAQTVENTTHGSGWFIQILSTKREPGYDSEIPPTAVGWFVQILSNEH
jgi:hypothetical protein